MDYTVIQAAEIALRQIGKPSSAHELTDYILQHKLWETSATNPNNVVHSRICANLQKQGERSPFIQLKKSVFDLRERHEVRQLLDSQLEQIFDGNNLQENKSMDTNVPEAEEQPKHVEENSYYNVSEVKKILRDRLIDVNGELVIDGVIRVKMVVQVKRYKIGNNVQAPVVQQLRGNLNTVLLERGLLVTTSDFTKGAYQDAAAYGKPNIDLMNGEKLVDLLLKYEIGVKSQKVYTIDESMFSDLATLSSAQSPIS